MSELVFPLSLLGMLAGMAVIGLSVAMGFAQAMWWHTMSKQVPLRVLFSGLGLFGTSAVLWALSTHLEFALDKAEWRQVTVRAQPLVEAIKRYELDHGAPPGTLDALVPLYLSEVPSTGWGAHPDFSYGARAGNWRLWVNATKCLLSFDTFEYAPEDREFESANSTDRLGDWVYVHE